jgi:phospholipid-binding lipoprotein MlaA
VNVSDPDHQSVYFLSLPASREAGVQREVRDDPSGRGRASLAAIACLQLAACAHGPKTDMPTAQVYDPAERTNRAVFAVNRAVDHVAIAPVARGYRTVVPTVGRRTVRNFTSNLKEPEIAINDLLQANFRRAGSSSARFVINSTVGMAGVFDVAKHWGMPKHEADMGQTFGRWGMPAGPAVQVPLLGPSNLRDVTGGVLGSALNPTTYLTGGAAIAAKVVAAIGLVNGRAELLPLTDRLEAASPDYYADLRNRAAKERTELVAQAQHPRTGEANEHPARHPAALAPDISAFAAPAHPDAAPKPEEQSVPTPPAQSAGSSQP